MDLEPFVREFILAFTSKPENNNLGPGHPEKAWDSLAVGISRGDDELYGFLKEHIGGFHMTPAEAFAAYSPEKLRPDPTPRELAVVSFALAQTETTKAAQRARTRFASEAWARSRMYGQKKVRSLQYALVDALAAEGYHAVAPGLKAEEADSPTYGQSSQWSERHVGYISGLGTFGLSGGLITSVGKAVRLGSVVVRSEAPATPRLYTDPFQYCLFFQDGSCGECADRCPVGSVSRDGRDKPACAHELRPASEEYVLKTYGFEGYGCGLCQTAVPCESRIPALLRS